MSFSPEVENKYLAVANVMAQTQNIFNPMPKYRNFAERDIGDYEPVHRSPIAYPTLLSVDKYAYDIPRAFFESQGVDYLVYCIKATLVDVPRIQRLGSSGFLSWNEGMGYAFANKVWGYTNGGPGSNDNYVTTITFDSFSDNWTNVDSDYNGKDASEYYKDSFNTTPFEIFHLDTRFAYGYDTGTTFTAGGGIAATTRQVLMSTNFSALKGTNTSFILDGTWVRPSSTTSLSRERRRYPLHKTPTPVASFSPDGLTLYRQTIEHKYDSGYDYVRQDIRERFKTPEFIEEQRDNHINAIIDNYVSTLDSTVNVPRGFMLRKQASIKVMRQNYTTFSEDYESVTPSTTSATMSAGATSGMSSTAGGGTGGTY